MHKYLCCCSRYNYLDDINKILFIEKIKRTFNKHKINDDVEMEQTKKIEIEEMQKYVKNRIDKLFKNNNFKKKYYCDNELDQNIKLDIVYIIKICFLEFTCRSEINQEIIKVSCNMCTNYTYVYEYFCQVCEWPFILNCSRYECRLKFRYGETMYLWKYNTEFTKHMECILRNDEYIVKLYNYFIDR